jgi:hypothetical protein
MPVLFAETFCKTYYSPLFSQSSILCITLSAFAIVLPFLAAFSTEDFWIKISTYSEQSVIEFNHQFILHVLQNDESYFYSSISKLNEQYDNIIPYPIVEVKLF